MTTPSPSAEAAPSLQDQYDALNAQITKQGSLVRQLKKDGAVADAIAQAVQQLQALKLESTSLQEQVLLASSASSSAASFQRKSFDDLMIRKMFIVPAFEIHGGVKGLYDLGPPACALKVCEI
jgi:glycyl-tRNA synthetase